VVVQLVQGQVGWVLVQAQVLQEEGLVLVQMQVLQEEGLVLVQAQVLQGEGQVVVGKRKMRGQDHNNVSAAAQPPVQYQPMPHYVPPLEPLPDDTNYLYTSGTPTNVDMEEGQEDSQGTSLSSQATLDILLYRDTDAYMQKPLMPREPSPVSK
jgi:hypothetical protein